MTMPEWRPIPGFEGRYSVSDTGQVLRHEQRRENGAVYNRKEKVLKQHIDAYGYASVALCLGGARTEKHRVSRLVLRAFVGPAEGREAAHLDHDPRNNVLRNLAWATRLENEQQKTEAGRRPRTTVYSDQRVSEVRALRTAGYSLRALHGAFRTPLTYLCSMCTGKARA